MNSPDSKGTSKHQCHNNVMLSIVEVNLLYFQLTASKSYRWWNFFFHLSNFFCRKIDEWKRKLKNYIYRRINLSNCLVEILNLLAWTNDDSGDIFRYPIRYCWGLSHSTFSSFIALIKFRAGDGSNDARCSVGTKSSDSFCINALQFVR